MSSTGRRGRKQRATGNLHSTGLRVAGWLARKPRIRRGGGRLSDCAADPGLNSRAAAREEGHPWPNPLLLQEPGHVDVVVAYPEFPDVRVLGRHSRAALVAAS